MRPDITLRATPVSRCPSVPPRPVAWRELSVADVRAADEYAGPAAAQRRRIDASALDRLPRGLKQQSLLRVHRPLPPGGRDPEEFCIEIAHAVDEPAMAHVALSRLLGIGIIERLEVPPPVVRQAGNGIHATVDQPPEVLRRLNASGEAAGHPHDRDRLGVPGLDQLKPLPGPSQVGSDQLQIFACSLSSCWN